MWGHSFQPAPVLTLQPQGHSVSDSLPTGMWALGMKPASHTRAQGPYMQLQVPEAEGCGQDDLPSSVALWNGL